jgi:FkbM family methyltransferase
MSLRQIVKRLITPGRIWRIRDSAPYGWYRCLVAKEDADLVKSERAFFASLIAALPPGPIFDIGANRGDKAVQFASTGRVVVCLEPSSQNANLLRARFKYNPRVVVIEEGVSAQSGVESLYVFDETSGFNTFSEKWKDVLEDPNRSRFGVTMQARKSAGSITMTTLDRLIERFGVPSFVKIDVEGYELNVLKGLSTPVPLLSFECNLPEYQEETVECLELLSKINPACLVNYCLDGPSTQFVLQSWQSTRQVAEVVTGGKERFMEIYCKFVS